MPRGLSGAIPPAPAPAVGGPRLVAVGAAMFLAVTLVVAGDTAGKALGGLGVHPFLIAWARFLLALLLLAPVLGPLGANLRQAMHPGLALRGAVIAAGIASILTALRTEPIADVYGAFFIGPVIAYVLSLLMLGERSDLARGALMGLGFLGVLMVVQPGLNFRFGIVFALFAGGMYGLDLVLTRRFAGRYRPGAMLFSQLFWGSVVLAPMGLWHAGSLLGQPTPGRLALILVSALGSAAGNYLIVRISRQVPASVVAPMVYLQLISAAVMGWLAFGALPDPLALAGLAVITASGLGSLWFARSALR